MARIIHSLIECLRKCSTTHCFWQCIELRDHIDYIELKRILLTTILEDNEIKQRIIEKLKQKVIK